MSMLQSLMSNVMSGAKAPTPGDKGSTTEDPNAKAYRTLLATMVKPDSGYSPEQIASVIERAPEGVDTSYFASIAGMPTPEQQAKLAFDNEVYNSFLTLLNGGQPPGQQPVVSAPTAPTPAPQPAPTSQANLFAGTLTKDIVLRKVYKDLAGFDVGEHYFEAPLWFKEHRELTQGGVLDSEATRQLAAKYGFVPDGASSLVSTPEDKMVLFEKELAASLRNPVIDGLWKETAPEKYWNNPKQKTGWILSKMAASGQRYIPEHYQPFLDRYRGLEDPEFVDDDMKTWIHENTGKFPSEIEPSDIAKARGQMDDHAILQSARKIASDILTRLKAEGVYEAEKPISAKDAATEGIDVKKYPTYYELADAGKRFPTADERKVYEDMLNARTKLLDLMPLMFGVQFDPNTLEPMIDANGKPIGNPEEGIFTGITPGWWGRAKGKMSLTKERAMGTMRGQYALRYDKIMADIARTLLVISGDTRFSDVDVIQMIKTQADLGIGLFDMPDSAPNAHYLIKRFLQHNANYLDRMLTRTTIKAPQSLAPPAASDADTAAQALIDKYKKEKK